MLRILTQAKLRKIKANERDDTMRIISEFNTDFANSALFKLDWGSTL